MMRCGGKGFPFHLRFCSEQFYKIHKIILKWFLFTKPSFQTVFTKIRSISLEKAEIGTTWMRKSRNPAISSIVLVLPGAGPQISNNLFVFRFARNCSKIGTRPRGGRIWASFGFFVQVWSQNVLDVSWDQPGTRLCECSKHQNLLPAGVKRGESGEMAGFWPKK